MQPSLNSAAYTYELSVENPSEETVIPTINSAYKGNTAKILLVKDNISLLNYLIEKLNKNYAVYPATSAEEAGQLLEDNDIDLIVSDIRLPNKDDDVFLRRNKIKHKNKPYSYYTSYCGSR